MTFDTFEYVSSKLEHSDFPHGEHGNFFQRGFPHGDFFLRRIYPLRKFSNGKVIIQIYIIYACVVNESNQDYVHVDTSSAYIHQNLK